MIQTFWPALVTCPIKNLTSKPIYFSPFREFMLKDEAGKLYAPNWDGTLNYYRTYSRDAASNEDAGLVTRDYGLVDDPKLAPLNPGVTYSFSLVFDMPDGPQALTLGDKDGLDVYQLYVALQLPKAPPRS
jgi:hypothetical protein